MSAEELGKRLLGECTEVGLDGVSADKITNLILESRVSTPMI